MELFFMDDTHFNLDLRILALEMQYGRVLSWQGTGK